MSPCFFSYPKADSKPPFGELAVWGRVPTKNSEPIFDTASIKHVAAFLGCRSTAKQINSFDFFVGAEACPKGSGGNFNF